MNVTHASRGLTRVRAASALGLEHGEPGADFTTLGGLLMNLAATYPSNHRAGIPCVQTLPWLDDYPVCGTQSALFDRYDSPHVLVSQPRW
jgi:hypothetical protein